MDENPYEAPQGKSTVSRRDRRAPGGMVAALSAMVMIVLGTSLVPGVVFVLDRDLFYDQLQLLIALGACFGLALGSYSLRASRKARDKSGK